MEKFWDFYQKVIEAQDEVKVSLKIDPYKSHSKRNGKNF